VNRGLFLVAGFFVAACGADNSLVGGRCMDGFAVEDGRCVHSTSPGAPVNEPADAPSTSPSNEPSVRKPYRSPTTSFSDVNGGPTGDTTGPSGNDTATCTFSDTDPNNCGACGKRCPSNICVAGECQGAITGDVVLIGHEYSASWTLASQTKLLVNAVGIPTTYPIRVADFEGGAWAASDERSLLDGGIIGRSIDWTDANDPSFLEADDLARRFDVVLLHAAGTDGSALGTRWSASLSKFAKKGGVIVALDDGSTDMPALVRKAGLLDVQGHTFLGGGAHIIVTAPGNALGVQVISPYAPIGASFGFTGLQENQDLSFVARVSLGSDTDDDVGLPVAIHRVVR